jgi:hypothetical protein
MQWMKPQVMQRKPGTPGVVVLLADRSDLAWAMAKRPRAYRDLS